MLAQPFAVGAQKSLRLLSLLFSCLVLTVMAGDVCAQIGAIDSDPAQAIGTRATARNTLQGVVLLPSGARLNGRAKVRISGISGASLFTMTDENGAFIFARLAGGTYNVTVNAGDEYETATEVVDIFDLGRSSQGITQTVYIQLSYKTKVGTKPGTLSAELAGVPKPALKEYEKGLKAAQSGDNKKAVEAFKSAIELYKDFMLAYNALGLQYLHLNQLPEAAEALQRAVQLAPENFTPLFNYGVVLFYRKEYTAAAEQFRLALKKRDKSSAAHFLLARTFVKLNQYSEAEKEFNETIKIGGAEAGESYRYLGGIYLAQGQDERALAALEKYLSMEPNAKDADSVKKIIAGLRKQPAKNQK